MGISTRDLPALTLAPRRATLTDVRRAIDELLRLEARAAAPPSPTGGQIDALTLGLCGDGDEHLWRRTRQAEERLERRALLLVAWGRLSPLEQSVVLALHTPIGVTRVERTIRGGIDGDREEWERRGYHWLGPSEEPGMIRVIGLEPRYPNRREISAQFSVSIWRVGRAITRVHEVFRAWLDEEEDTP